MLKKKTLNDMLIGCTAVGFWLVATCSDALYLIGNGAAGQLFSSKVALPSNATVALYPPAMSATARNATLFLNLALVNSDLTPHCPVAFLVPLLAESEYADCDVLKI